MILYKKFVMICSVCWRARCEEQGAVHEDSGWRDLNALINEEHLDGDDYALSYGYCPTCGEGFVQEVHARQLTAGPPYDALHRPALH